MGWWRWQLLIEFFPHARKGNYIDRLRVYSERSVWPINARQDGDDIVVFGEEVEFIRTPTWIYRGRSQHFA